MISSSDSLQHTSQDPCIKMVDIQYWKPPSQPLAPPIATTSWVLTESGCVRACKYVCAPAQFGHCVRYASWGNLYDDEDENDATHAATNAAVAADTRKTNQEFWERLYRKRAEAISDDRMISSHLTTLQNHKWRRIRSITKKGQTSRAASEQRRNACALVTKRGSSLQQYLV